MERKKEYHRRVSPMVRKGGRSKLIHIPTINTKKIAEPIPDKLKAPVRYPLKAKNAPIIQHTPELNAYMSNDSQLILCPPCSF